MPGHQAIKKPTCKYTLERYKSTAMKMHSINKQILRSIQDMDDFLIIALFDVYAASVSFQSLSAHASSQC